MPSARPRSVDRPLRRDVRLLGRLLGEVIRETEGEALFELEERIRKLAISRRRGPAAGRAEAERRLDELVASLDEASIEPLVRAFSLYFRLVNLAEQHHRLRRARAYARLGAEPQRGSYAAVLGAAKRAGTSAEQARRALSRLEVTLTLTAHPTEAARRTVLEKLDRIASILEARDRERLSPAEEREAREAMREEIAILWRTDEVRSAKPTVGDEVKNVLWYVENVLWDAMPRASRAVSRAFEEAFGEPLGPAVMPLRIHSWVGGDMDGNPSVRPEVVEDALRAYERRGLRLALEGVRELGAALSQSARRVKVPERLLESIARDAEAMPSLAGGQGAATEPFRRKLRFVEGRLLATLAEVDARRQQARSEGALKGSPMPEPRALGSAPPPSALPYSDGEALAADLRLVADSLEEAGCARAGGRLARELLLRVESLGLHAAELELRATAEETRAAADLLESAGGPAGGSAGGSAGAPLASSPETEPFGARLAETLRRVASVQREAGERACRTLVLSMAESERDVRAALRAARAAGLWDASRKAARLDVVPLFETLEALEGSARVLETLLGDSEYARHLEARGVQEVMVGYSDSGKQVGLLAASGALRRAQEAMVEVAGRRGVPLRIFHGRGESVARGGGPAQQAILALAPGSVAGRYKATEQGEALDHKYGRPWLADRTLELIVGGAFLHTLSLAPRPEPEAEARYRAAFDELAEEGRRAYRALVWEEPRFVRFFAAATPIDEIGSLNIGSRPAKRKQGGLESLRAIPWVFAWTQNRVILPGFYGVGRALERFGKSEAGAALLAEMFEKDPFFRAVIDNVEMVLAKSDLAIGARYAELADPEDRRAVFEPIVEEHARTRAWVRRLTGARRLAEGNPPLRRSIDLRNPYVDPLSLIQVALLRKKREGRLASERALLASLSGIAAGMRNTG